MSVMTVSNHQIEKNLAFILQGIEREKETALSFRNVVLLTAREFKKDFQQSRWGTAAKIATLCAVGACLHPLIVGSIACFNIYRIQHWNDLYSSDIDTANTATQLYSNSGHGVGYLLEAVELVAISAGLLLRSCYKKAVAREISAIYEKAIAERSGREEQDFLWKLKMQELNQCSFAYLPPVDTRIAKVSSIEMKEKISNDTDGKTSADRLVDTP